MNARFALLLGLLVVTAAVFAGQVAQSGERYFPQSYERQTELCEVEPGWDFEVRPSTEQVLHPGDAAWFGGVLSSLDERPLYRRTQAEVAAVPSVIRFTWVRSFSPEVVIRVERGASGDWHLIARQASKATGYRTYEREKRLDRILSKGEIERVTSASVPVFTSPRNGCFGGADGAVWIMERVEGRTYGMVKRWTPQAGPTRELGMVMVGLTGWDVGDIY